MGKCKRRLINAAKNNSDFSITREDAIKKVCEELTNNFSDKNAINLITMFGLTAEELAEAGMDYETLKVLGKIIN